MNLQTERLLIGFFQASKAAFNSNSRDTGLNEALKIIAQATDVDRVYICKHMTEYDTDEMYFSLIYEWASNEVEHQIKSPNFRKISYGRFSLLSFYENLSEGRPLRFVLNKLSEEERLGFLDPGIKSIVLIPIIVDENYWGFLGLDEVNTDREWSDADVDILIKFAGRLAVLIKEDDIEKMKRIKKQNIKLSLIDENNFLKVLNDDDKTDENLLAEILNIYLKEIPLMGKEIEAAIQNNNIAALKYHAHRLGGSLLNLGAESVVTICHQIEKAAKQNLIDENVINMNTQLKENIRRLILEITMLRDKFLKTKTNS